MPTITTSYNVVDDLPVFVDVRIGDGQAGGSAVFIGTDLRASGPAIENIDLGLGHEVRGRVLVVSTTVIDVRPEHDHTSVTVILRGGEPPAVPVEQSATARPGGAMNYLTVVSFV